MKLLKLVGVVDRVAEGVAAIVPDDGTRELYVPANDLNDPREGQNVDLIVIPPTDPNGLCKVVSFSRKKLVKPLKIRSDSTLLKAMTRSRDKLKATLDAVESNENADPDVIEDLREKIRFLDQGIELFS
ncbi:MAG TPA: hypothetical protein PKM25_04915 [Candidatus Ozemobacteraceae bacterium]|nr:hypothetical protein [Candidatus Ozemobacteraceae bacterium]